MPTSNSTAAETIQIARQPIFDQDLAVFGYELLYRDASGRCRFEDGDLATSRTLLNTFIEIGLERIAGEHPVFVNLTRSFFVDMPPIPFNHERVVLEILEDVHVDEALVAAVTRAREEGYRLALDDYTFQPELAPLLPQVHFIKVEVPTDDLDSLQHRLPDLRRHGAKLLAEKVETAEQFERLRAMGFDYFQGYFFARPNLVSSTRAGENAAMVMQLVAKLNDPDAEMDDIVALVSQDPGMSFKVMRYVNSAAVGLRRQIDSIQQAVVLMGLARLRAWATLFAMAGVGVETSEILSLGLVRATLCEQLSRVTGRVVPETAYTVGLLSIIDVVLGRPMQSIVEELPLGADVKLALCEQQGPYGELLRTVVQIEQNEPLTAMSIEEIEVGAVNEAYADSIATAQALMAEVELG